MTNLSELSKPVMYVVRTLDGSVASVKSHSYTAPKGFTSEPLYSQEYVSALKHESAVNWEAAASLNVENQELKKRIAELEAIQADASQVFKEIGNELSCNPDNESIMIAIDDLKKDNTSLRDQRAGLVQAASELGAKLATPVRLPDTRESVSGDRYQWSDGVHNYRLDVISMLLGAGFTVAVEGDDA
ncbi:hypothetical protein [Clostridium perfringens]|uniref:hypothetical protein n=1 Tax=Clostridium perfringens TaxID=1502 RepID=UPI003221D131